MSAKTSEGILSWREGRRRRAWALCRKGWNVVRIAEALGVTHGAVSQWLAAGREHGWQGLRPKRRLRQGTRLSHEQERRLVGLMQQGAEAHGFVGPLWTAPRVAQLIARVFGVTYHPDHVRKLLRQLEWSFQKTVVVALEHDDRAVANWLRKTWPAIKKKRTKKAESSSFSTRAPSISRRSPRTRGHPEVTR